MQPYPMNQQGGYADAMPGHGPGASSGDSGARLSPGGGFLTRAWRAVALVMGSPGKPRSDASHPGRDASDARKGRLCDTAGRVGQEGTEQESGEVSGFAHGRETAGRTPIWRAAGQQPCYNLQLNLPSCLRVLLLECQSHSIPCRVGVSQGASRT